MTCIGDANAAACEAGFEPFLTCEIEASREVLNVCYNNDIGTYRFGSLIDPELTLTETVEMIDCTP